jgi:hypothetical protein
MYKGKKMNSNRYTSNGQVNGGYVGSIIFGVLIAIFFNIIVAPGTQGDAPVAFRVIFAILSIVNIPIAILGQLITRKTFSIFFGKTRMITKRMSNIIYRKYLGAILFPATYDTIMIIILFKIFF